MASKSCGYVRHVDINAQASMTLTCNRYAHTEGRGNHRMTLVKGVIVYFETAKVEVPDDQATTVPG